MEKKQIHINGVLFGEYSITDTQIILHSIKRNISMHGDFCLTLLLIVHIEKLNMEFSLTDVNIEDKEIITQ